jgi:hypothetical protein
MLGDPSRMVWTLASRAGGIDRPISRSASVLARPKAVAARRRPINSAAIASAFARPANWWSRSPAAASTTPISAAMSSTTIARSVGSLVCRRKDVVDSPHWAASRRACVRPWSSEIPSAEKATARTIQATRYRSTAAPGEELADGESDRHAAADQERRDRRDEYPQESCTPVAERVPGIRRAAPMPQRHPEKQLVDGVRGRVSGLRKESGGTRRQAGGELRRGHDEVRQQRDRDAAFISPALAGSDRRERAPR